MELAMENAQQVQAETDVTASWDKARIQALLDSWMVEGRENGKGMYRALQSLFERQTSTEQSTEETHDLNGVGFNGFDAPILSEIAKRSQRYQSLTPKQTRLVGKKLKKYWKQLADIANAKQSRQLQLAGVN